MPRHAEGTAQSTLDVVTGVAPTRSSAPRTPFRRISRLGLDAGAGTTRSFASWRCNPTTRLTRWRCVCQTRGLRIALPGRAITGSALLPPVL